MTDIEVFAEFVRYLDRINHIDLLLKIGDLNVAAEKWDKGDLCIYSDGAQFWYQNDKLHCDVGPAVTWDDGTQVWYKNGLRHRDSGPAFIGANGTQEWWRHGKKVNPC